MNEPKLRFKADDGNQFPSWDEKKLGDICTPLTYGMNVAAIKYDGLNKYIRITDIDDESHLYKSDEYVSPNGVLDDRYLVGENDILFARTGASVGKSYIYNKKDGKLYYAGFLIKAHVKSENSNFVFYQTLTERYAKWVQLTSMRSGQPGINANEYSEFGIQIPCLQEQQKIASLFTELDNLIQSAEKELEGYRELKQCMLQKMFPKKGETVPEIRFPEFTNNWEPCKFGSLLNESRNKTICENEDTLLSCAIDGMYLNSELFSHFRGSSNIGYLKVEKNDLILSAQNLHLGNCNVNLRFEHGIISPAYKVYKLVKCTPLFMQAWVKRDITKEFFLRASTEGASACRKNILWDELYEQKLLVPCLEEQTKIGEYFQNLDNLIISQQQEFNSYKELKKGLLQQMFC